MESHGFELNPYNPCVVNNMVNDNHMTIVCHVDYLNISHMDDNEVTQNIKETKIVYYKDMQVLQVNKRDYLLMELDFSIAGEVWVTIIDSLKKVISNFLEDIMSTPTPKELGGVSG